MEYVYPAIFTKEDDGKYSVDFPDLEGCYTCGDDLTHAMEMAEDLLAFHMYLSEKNNETVNSPSFDLKAPEGAFVNLIKCDTIAYQKRNNSKAVKKTLSI